MDCQQVTAAIDCIDDDIGWVDDHPVGAAELWCDVMRSAVGGGAEVVLVYPTWWPMAWVDVVHDATLTAAATVVVISRAQVLCASASKPSTTVVEIAGELVVIAQPGVEFDAVARRSDIEADTAVVAARIGHVDAVLVDIPEGVDEGRSLGEAIVKRLKSKGVSVTMTDRDYLCRAAAAVMPPEQARVGQPPAAGARLVRFNRRGTAVLAGTLLSVAALCGGFAFRGGTPALAANDMPMALLVAGRVGVKVPAQWAVQRITSGPGSARLQVVSPSDVDIAVHITQSPLADQQTREVVAATLRNALNDEPAGVFVDFNPQARYADKPAVTYREVRPDRHVRWIVLVDKTLRIAIGCQSGPGREHLVRDVCDRAVSSAHAVF